jgi:hypothetical protein
MDRLQIERMGGLAGFGGPHLKSRGEMSLLQMSPADRQAVESLFSELATTLTPRPGHADAFRYRITRQTPSGPQTIEVPEERVPASVRDCVKDILE